MKSQSNQTEIVTNRTNHEDMKSQFCCEKKEDKKKKATTTTTTTTTSKPN